MFMEREEFRYGIKLGKIQFKYGGAYALIFAFVYLVNIGFGNYMGVMVNGLMGVELSRVIEFTTGMGYILLLYLMGFVVWGCCYKSARTAQEIYPQTNKSRFVANIFSDYLLILSMTVGSSLVNLSLVVVLPMLTERWDNAVLVDGLTLVDVIIIGSIVCGYGLLIQSVSLFVFSCIRKFKLWFLSVPLICMVWLTYNHNQFFAMVVAVAGFYFNESSFGLLLVKVVLTHVILNILSFLLEVNTEFHGASMNRKQGIRFAIATGSAAILILVGISNLVFTSTDSTYNVTIENVDIEEVASAETQRITLDVSHLEVGTEIILESSGNVINYSEEEAWNNYESEDEYYIYVRYQDNLVVDGDTLVLEYDAGKVMEENVNIYPYVQPEMTYELEGNVLKLGYECRNLDVKILYVTNMWASNYKSDSEVNNVFWDEYSYAPASLSIGIE